MTIQNRQTCDSPFADFIHCPRCGGASLQKHDARAIRCADCDFKFYFNCATATAAIILYHGKLLLGIRGKDPQKGKLDFPGGFVEFDETAEDALAREVREELNINVENLVYLISAPNDYWYANVLYKTTDIYFICTINDIKGIKPMDDVTDYLLAYPEQVDPQRLAFKSGRIALQKLLEHLSLTTLHE